MGRKAVKQGDIKRQATKSITVSQVAVIYLKDALHKTLIDY